MGDIAEYFSTTTCATSTACPSAATTSSPRPGPTHQSTGVHALQRLYLVESVPGAGMHIDDFAPNLGFFFSNGMDPEYTVMGRVASAHLELVAMKDKVRCQRAQSKL